MLEIFETIISAMLLGIVLIYGWYKLSNEKINFKNYKLYIVYIIFIITSVINGSMSNIFVKLIILLFIWMLLYYYLFKRTFREGIIVIIETQIIVILLEALVLMVLMSVFRIKYEIINTNSFLKLAPNFVMFILIYCVFLFKFPVTIKNKILNLIDKLNSKTVVLFLILLMLCINISLAIIYYENTTILIMFIEFSILAIYTIITILILKEKNQKELYKQENIAQSKILQDYVGMLDHQKALNHENKNQLIMINGMAKDNQTDDIIKYTETALGEKKEDDTALYKKVKRIPLSSLQGLIYQKWLVMKNEKIEFKLVLPRRMKDIDFTKLDMKTNMDLCKIVGVFIDNAIEEVTKLGNKHIEFELYLKGKDMYIMVMNNYGSLVEDMDEAGKTSKGEGHGYGLSLVKEIIKKNKRLRNERGIMGNQFQQFVVITDMKSDSEK